MTSLFVCLRRAHQFHEGWQLLGAVSMSFDMWQHAAVTPMLKWWLVLFVNLRVKNTVQHFLCKPSDFLPGTLLEIAILVLQPHRVRYKDEGKP